MQDANSPAAVEVESREQRGMTFDELPVEAQLRLIHAERWVAWAADDQSVIAVGDTHAEVRAAARELGFPHAICEWITPPFRSMGRWSVYHTR